MEPVKFAWAVLGTLGAASCSTTQGSSASSFAGLGTNFKPAYLTFDGTFYQTLDMSQVSAGHYAFSEKDAATLALKRDPGRARGFIGVAHSSIFQTDGSTRNLVIDPAVTAPLDKLKSDLIAAWGGPAPDIKLFVAAERSYHGQAYPENFIVLPIGALIDVTMPAAGSPAGDEGEIAAFMAHELAHILLGHYKRVEETDARRKLNNSASALTLAGIALDGGKFEKRGDQYQFVMSNEKESQALMQRAMIYSALASETNALFTASQSREQEDHADLLAADLLARAGYQPTKLSDFLQRSSSGQQKAELALDQMSAQQKLLNQQLAQSLGAGKGNNWLDLGAGLAVSASVNLRDRLSQSHRSTDKRRENLNGYLTRMTEASLAETDGADATTESYRKSLLGENAPTNAALSKLKAGRAKSLIEAYAAAFDADRQLASLDAAAIASAKSGLERARKLGGAREPEILAISARYHAKTGRVDLAVRDLETAVKLDGAAPMMFAQLSSAYFLANNVDKALAAIVEGEELTGTNAPFFPLRIEYHFRRNEFAEALRFNAECQKTRADGLKQKCNEAIAPVNEAIRLENERKFKENQRQLQQNPLNELFKKKPKQN